MLHFLRKNVKNCIPISHFVSASGGLHPPDPIPGLCSWTPLGNFHPRPLARPTTIVKYWVRLCVGSLFTGRRDLLQSAPKTCSSFSSNTSFVVFHCSSASAFLSMECNLFQSIHNIGLNIATAASSSDVEACCIRSRPGDLLQLIEMLASLLHGRRRLNVAYQLWSRIPQCFHSALNKLLTYCYICLN